VVDWHDAEEKEGVHEEDAAGVWGSRLGVVVGVRVPVLGVARDPRGGLLAVARARVVCCGLLRCSALSWRLLLGAALGGGRSRNCTVSVIAS